MLSRPTRDNAVVTEDLGTEACLYLPHTDEAIVLNRTGADVWRLIDGERTVDELISELADRYATRADTIRKDVLRVIDELAHHGCLIDGNAG